MNTVSRGVMLVLAVVVAACGVEGPEVQSVEKVATPIRSLAELNAHLGSGRSSPLDALSVSARQAFIDSLVFSERGLASFRYVELKQELTAAQTYAVLEVFGLGYDVELIRPGEYVAAPVTSDGVNRSSSALRKLDHDNYWCSSRATCSQMGGSICISNC